MRYLRISPSCGLLLCLSTALVAQTRRAIWQAGSLGIEAYCDCGDKLPKDPLGSAKTVAKEVEQVILTNPGSGGKVKLELFAMSLYPYGMAAEQNILPLLKRSEGRVAMAAAEIAAGKDFARRYDIQVFPAYIFATEFTRGLRFERVLHMVVEKSGNYLFISRIFTTTYWSERHSQPGRLDLFAPDWIPEVGDEILRFWPRGRANIRVHHLWPPGDLDGIPAEPARRACLAAHQPERHPAYAGSPSKTLQVEDRHGWQEITRSASVDLQCLQTCIEGG